MRIKGLAGRSVLVTGGGSGIGAALVEAFGAAGCRVVATDVNGTTPVALDVTDAGAFERVVAEHGPIDVLVNNAGIGVGGEIHEMSREHWDRIIDVNIRGVVNGVRAVYPQMVARRSGRIINVASLAGLVPAPLLTPYAMTKHAVVGMSVSLRAEAAAHGIDVNVVCPAAVDTPLLDTPGDTPSSMAMNMRRFLTKDLGPAITPQALAATVIRGVQRNQAIIVAPSRARAAWTAMRMAPSLAIRMQERAARAERRAAHF